jgi:hypothetical protein
VTFKLSLSLADQPHLCLNHNAFGSDTLWELNSSDMEEFYSLNPAISCSDNICATTSAGFHHHAPMDNMLQFQAAEITDLIKTQIANHPLFPNLVSAHIQCQKVTFFHSIICFFFFFKKKKVF